MSPDTYSSIVQAGKAIFAYRQQRPDGSAATMEVTATTLRGGQLVAIVRDREEQRRMETAQRQSEAKFVKLFDASPVPLIVSRLDDRHVAPASPSSSPASTPSRKGEASPKRDLRPHQR